MPKTEELVIDKHSVTYGYFKFDNKKHLYKKISDLEHLKHRLEYFGVKTDFDLESITEEDDFKLWILMDKKPSTRKYNINLIKYFKNEHC